MRMRREQRRRHVVLYVAHGNRMRCRHNRDSVLDTLHVQPPLHHSIDCFFRTTISPRGRTFVGRRLRFRHAGNAPRDAVRSAKLGKNTRCILREAFYVNTSAAVKRARSTQPTLALNARERCSSARAERCFERARQRLHEERIGGIDATCTARCASASATIGPTAATCVRASAASTLLREQQRTADRPATRS